MCRFTAVTDVDGLGGGFVELTNASQIQKKQVSLCCFQ